jgi:hypothetical protein
VEAQVALTQELIMSIRQSLQNNPAIFAGVAVLVLGFAVWRMATVGHGNALENHRYFFDLGTGELFTHDVSAMPPVTAPSGGDGVLATVYTCGACSSEAERKIAYIITYTEEALALMQQAMGENANPGAMAAAQAQRLIAAPSQQPQWVAFDDPRSGQLLSFADQCPGGKAEICLP